MQTNIDGDFKQMYNKSFQRLMLAHLVKDQDLFEKAEVLEVNDFETAPCQTVWEAAKDYYRMTGRLPDKTALELHVHKVALNAEGLFKSYIKPEEAPALLDLVDWIASIDPINCDYFAEELPSFIKGVRTSKIMDEGRNAIIMGGQADELISRLQALKSQVDERFAEEMNIFITAKEDPGFITLDEYIPPIPTGLPPLDQKLGGGVNRGEVCLVQAPSGVGKTNLLLHFALAPAYSRLHGLFFSLELPGKKVRGRYISMASGMEAENLKIPYNHWEDSTWELAASTLAHNPVLDRTTFVDFSTHKPTTAELERRIIEWKKLRRDQGIPEEQLAVVCIDWVDYVRPPFVTKKNMEDWERYIMVAQELGFIARRNNVVIWIANQTTKEAERKAIMRMGDTARGYHLHDAMDLSIGANIHPDDKPNEDGEEGLASPPGCRKMVFTIMKNRNGDLGSFEAFRAPSLRMFENQQSYFTYRSALNSIKGVDERSGAARVNMQLQGLYKS